jgi:hypothetical protein
MLKRLILGLLIGLIMGSLVAALLVKGMGLVAFGGFLAYLFAAVTGVVVGLVAGKPIWAKGGQIEAGLKALVGAIVGAGAMFAIRQWLHLDVDLSQFAAGHDEIGNLPAVSLPLIAAVLGGFYEIDNTPEPEADAKKSSAKDAGKPAAKGKVRVASADEVEAEEEAEAPPKRAKR